MVIECRAGDVQHKFGGEHISLHTTKGVIHCHKTHRPQDTAVTVFIREPDGVRVQVYWLDDTPRGYQFP